MSIERVAYWSGLNLSPSYSFLIFQVTFKLCVQRFQANHVVEWINKASRRGPQPYRFGNLIDICDTIAHASMKGRIRNKVFSDCARLFICLLVEAHCNRSRNCAYCRSQRGPP